ncbi:MAG TPA: peptidoglycan DD-metalloendopeptidase family protein [Pseudonocardiaceae bacterium]
MERKAVAKHRSLRGNHPSPALQIALERYAAQHTPRHRGPAASAVRGRVVAAAVAAGAMSFTSLGITGTAAADEVRPATVDVQKSQKVVSQAAAPQKAASPKRSGATSYTVKRGDTLTRIAAKLGVEGGWKALYERNSDIIKNPNLIYPGQKLVVGEARDAGQAKTAAPSTAAKKAPAKKTAQQAPAPKQAEKSSTGFVRPTVGRFTSGYGARWGTTHYGIDIANKIGTPILSVADGTVINAGPASGFGLWVRVQHNDGTITVYGHVNTINVKVGQKVKAGQQIATMGNRGQSTGPHLHFEVIVGGKKINPLPWLAARGITVG